VGSQYLAAITNLTNSVNGVLQPRGIFNFGCEVGFAEKDNLVTQCDITPQQPTCPPLLTTACGISCSAPGGSLLSTLAGGVGNPMPTILGPNATGLVTSDGTPMASSYHSGMTTGVYRNSQDCGWTLQAPAGKRITVTFMNTGVFALEDPFTDASKQCDQDWLQLFDGSTIDPTSTFNRTVGKIARFCSAQQYVDAYYWGQFHTQFNAAGIDSIARAFAPQVNETFTSTGNSLTVWFHTDFENPYTGFALSYRVH